jgi:hypothetical protein
MHDLLAKLWDTSRATTPERYSLNLRVEVMTLGTRIPFPMHSVNISRSGALLKIDEGSSSLPFQNRTLLELVFYPDNSLLFGKIRATAKVVRHSPADGVEKAYLGIHILDIEDQEEWEALMQRFEASHFAA